MNLSLGLSLVLAVLALPGFAAAYDYRTLHLLQDRHTHAIIRVSEAPEGGDTVVRGWADCSETDALDRRGRNVARTFGRMFQRSGLHIDEILSSRVCRNIAAGKALQIGPVKEEPLLDPLGEGESAEERLDRLLGLLEGLRPGETALLLTHPAIVEALTGETLAPGEGLVFRLPPFGEVTVVGRFDLPPI